MPIKPFRDVKPGDEGLNYADESGTVITTGTYNDLKKYDSTGAAANLKNDQWEDNTELLQEMVAVLDDTENHILYVYGADGFAVYIQ